MRLVIIILLFSINVFANTDFLILKEATKKNEQQLINNHKIINNKWFENYCMALSERMQFRHINQCRIFKSKNANAYVLSNGHVYFSTKIMQYIKNKHQWASILAHENGHLVLNHYMKQLKKIQKPGLFFPKSKIKKMIKQHEKQADLWAVQTLKKFNYDPEQISFFLQRIQQSTGKHKSNNHLKLSKRIKPSSEKEEIDVQLIEKIELELVRYYD